MKLRYYLRGLGIGILVTALLLGIAGGKEEKLNDAQIRARAAQLGMVEGSSRVLEDLQTPEAGTPETLSGEAADVPGTADAPKETAGTESPEETNGKDPGAETAETERNVPENTGAADRPEDPLAAGQQPGTGSEPAEPVGSSPAPSEPDAEEELPEGESVRFTISSGSGSYSICRDLEQAGLVEDAGAFDAFLNENGYSRRLRTGTFSIPAGAGMEEIARILTGG